MCEGSLRVAGGVNYRGGEVTRENMGAYGAEECLFIGEMPVEGAGLYA